MIRNTFIIALSFIFLSLPATAKENEQPKDSLKLYRLECGEIHVADLNVFSDTDQYVGREKTLTDSCYLIIKGDKKILWDAGLPQDIAEKPEGVVNGVFTLKVPKTIKAQLAEVDLKPEDITHVGISHAHFDHTGALGLFKNATLVIQQAEFDLLKNNTEEAKAHHMPPEVFAPFFKNPKRVQLLNGDTDLFGDGTLKAITLPGHTPGHMALFVKLDKSRPVILSGDQWHFTENMKKNGVPSFNFDRADTLASSDKLARLLKNTGAQLIIQHDTMSNRALPAFPEFLD